jgi:hypothetical protein
MPAKRRRKVYLRIDPKQSKWWNLYVASMECNRSWRSARLFRRRFGLPWIKFRELLDEAKENDWFPSFSGRPDVSGRPGAPLELLLLGALRYLRRGWTFDDLSECTGISEEVHRKFFHDFIRVGSTTLFTRLIYSFFSMECLLLPYFVSFQVRTHA